MNRSRRAWLRKWLLVVAVVVLFSVPFFRSYSLRDRPLKEDEIYWIGQTYYFYLACEARDWSNSDWQLLPARENPVLGKYVIGLGLQLGGLRVTNVDWLGIFYLIAKDRPNAWGNVRDRAERRAVVNRMEPAGRKLALKRGQFQEPPAYVLTARLVMLVFGVISVLAVFVLTTLYTNMVVAFLAALLFSLHPAMVDAYTEVGVDILAIAFSLLAVICFALIERNIWRRCSHPKLCRVLLCIGGGLSLALAVGSKLNAAVVGLVGAVMCVWFAISFLRRWSVDAKDSCTTMIWLLGISLVVFVVSNPGNFPNPAKGLWALCADQQRSLEVQMGIPTLQQPLQSWSGKFLAVADLTAFHPVLFALIAGAFVLQIMQVRKPGGPFPLIALWWLIAVVAVTAWIPFDRARYALPVIAPSLVLIGCALGRLCQTGRSRMAERRKNT